MAKLKGIVFSDKQLKDIHIIQEVPNLFSEMKPNGTKWKKAEIVRQALKVCKELNLIPENSTLRNVWYWCMKKCLENAGFEPKPSDFYDNASKHMKDSGEYYEDYNIINTGIVFSREESKGFGNISLCIEKESAEAQFSNICKLLGLNLFASGGQPSLAGTEYIMKYWKEKKNGYLDNELPENIELVILTDFDPAGLNIKNSYYEQHKIYADRLGIDVVAFRIGIDPQYYTQKELEQGLYEASNTHHNLWTEKIELLHSLSTELGIPEEIFNSIYGNYLKDNFKSWNDKLGLEVESLPADPTPIFSTLFPEYIQVNDWKGQARLRLILFKDLISRHGIDNYMNEYLQNCFTNSSQAEKIVKEKANFVSLDKTTENISKMLESIQSNMENIILDEEKDVREKLSDWSEKFIEEKMTNIEYKHEFTQKLLNQVMHDRSYCRSTDFYGEIPEEIKDFRISEEKKERINEINNKLTSILNQLASIMEELKESERTSLEDKFRGVE